MKIVYDAVLRRPGCVLLQSTLGGTICNFSKLFPAESWLLAPTPNLKLYEVTQQQLDKLVVMSEVHNKGE